MTIRIPYYWLITINIDRCSHSQILVGYNPIHGRFQIPKLYPYPPFLPSSHWYNTHLQSFSQHQWVHRNLRCPLLAWRLRARRRAWSARATCDTSNRRGNCWPWPWPKRGTSYEPFFFWELMMIFWAISIWGLHSSIDVSFFKASFCKDDYHDPKKSHG